MNFETPDKPQIKSVKRDFLEKHSQIGHWQSHKISAQMDNGVLHNKLSRKVQKRMLFSAHFRVPPRKFATEYLKMSTIKFYGTDVLSFKISRS